MDVPDTLHVQAAACAMAGEHKVGNRILDVKRATKPGEDAPSATSGRIFVKGLSLDATSSDLQEAFEGYGQIKDVRNFLQRQVSFN